MVHRGENIGIIAPAKKKARCDPDPAPRDAPDAEVVHCALKIAMLFRLRQRLINTRRKTAADMEEHRNKSWLRATSGFLIGTNAGSSCSALMRLTVALTSYTAAVGIPAAVLIGGVLWLVTPDPLMKAEARVAPIPQKILESIERKKPFPVQEEPIAAPASVPVKPAMQEAAVSLTEHPAQRIKIREISAPPIAPKQRREVKRVTPDVAASVSPRPGSTARSDSPY